VKEKRIYTEAESKWQNTEAKSLCVVGVLLVVSSGLFGGGILVKLCWGNYLCIEVNFSFEPEFTRSVNRHVIFLAR